MATIELQIEEVRAKLFKYKCKVEFVNSLFTYSIVPKIKVLNKEFGLMSWLMKYDKAALIFILNELVYCNNKKSNWSVLNDIGILPLLSIIILAATFIYYNYYRISIYLLVVLFIAVISILSMVIIEWLNYASKFKNEKCIYLIEETIRLKETDMSEKELQLLFESTKDIMVAFKAHKVKNPISLIEEARKKKREM